MVVHIETAAKILGLTAMSLATPPVGGARLEPQTADHAGVAVQAMASTRIVDRVQVSVQPDEARAALRILELRAANRPVPDEAWADLFDSEGYRRQADRERDMDERLGLRRGFSDSSFREWAESQEALDDLGGRRAALATWKDVDVEAAAAAALAYLPDHARIRAIVYPLLRRATNSFVHDLGGERPSVFMYLDPALTAPEIEHILAHELHHVGLMQACSAAAANDDTQAGILRSFGEGLAVLAAAGGPDAETHPVRSDPARAAWDRRVDSLAVDMAVFEAFMAPVFAGERPGSEAVRSAYRFSSREDVPQGEFYSLGWFMAATIEREMGRETLLGGMCRPERLFLDYDVAAAAIAARDPASAPPRWSDEFLDWLRERAGRV